MSRSQPMIGARLVTHSTLPNRMLVVRGSRVQTPMEHRSAISVLTHRFNTLISRPVERSIRMPAATLAGNQSKWRWRHFEVNGLANHWLGRRDSAGSPKIDDPGLAKTASTSSTTTSTTTSATNVAASGTAGWGGPYVWH